MTKTLRVVADPSTVSMAEAIRVTASTAPLLVITSRALDDVAVELDGRGAARDYLVGLVESTCHRQSASPCRLAMAGRARRSSRRTVGPMNAWPAGLPATARISRQSLARCLGCGGHPDATANG